MGNTLLKVLPYKCNYHTELIYWPNSIRNFGTTFVCVRHHGTKKILALSVAQPKTCHHSTGECVPLSGIFFQWYSCTGGGQPLGHTQFLRPPNLWHISQPWMYLCYRKSVVYRVIHTNIQLYIYSYMNHMSHVVKCIILQLQKLMPSVMLLGLALNDC